ncbi:MAG: serine/threonine protein kinase, partial [Chloroflexota bacterium]
MESGTLLHNRYRIVETLGRGGMGAVYRALDDTLGVQVAVKENFFEDEEFTRQFRREATILANLRHPNLPRVTDHFILVGQGQYLVMDYIEGEDLKERLDRLGVMHPSETILMGTAICDALNYLHTHQPIILHRDIKPGNIKITSKGQIYLVDFGLAKIVQGTKKTTIGAQGLTPGYSPPEQYGSARTDSRSDIYSLSATLYVSLTGVPPEDSLSRMMEKATLTPMRQHNPSVLEEVEAVIQMGLAVQPEERYQTADEYRQALLGANKSTESLSTPKRTKLSPSPEPDGATRVVGHTVPVGSGKVTIPSHPQEKKTGVPKAQIAVFG